MHQTCLIRQSLSVNITLLCDQSAVPINLRAYVYNCQSNTVTRASFGNSET